VEWAGWSLQVRAVEERRVTQVLLSRRSVD